MFMLGTSWVWVSRRLRRWLTLRLYSRKITYRDGKPYLNAPLTVANKATIFAVHLVILGGSASAIVVGFVGMVRLRLAECERYEILSRLRRLVRIPGDERAVFARRPPVGKQLVACGDRVRV